MPRLYPVPMPWSLKRFHQTGALHFITWSCRDRQPLLAKPEHRDLLLKVLEQMRNRYRFAVVGYVVMPEHVHLLISEPLIRNISSAIAAVKLGFTRRVLSKNLVGNSSRLGAPPLAGVARGGDVSRIRRVSSQDMGAPLLAGVARSGGFPATHHIWTKRYYDFNVFTTPKIAEKLHYMHQNPVVRGLVERPEQWKWSSFRHYACGESGTVKVNDWSWWEEKIRSKVS